MVICTSCCNNTLFSICKYIYHALEPDSGMMNMVAQAICCFCLCVHVVLLYHVKCVSHFGCFLGIVLSAPLFYFIFV